MPPFRRVTYRRHDAISCRHDCRYYADAIIFISHYFDAFTPRRRCVAAIDTPPLLR